MLGALVLYAGLALRVDAPRVFDDELIYWTAAESLSKGHGVDPPGGDYAYGAGVLYPALLAPIIRASPDIEIAYRLAKILNALLFTLAAIPIYLLARRTLTQQWSTVVAALSLLVPSAMYVSVIMAESLAYFTVSLAVLGMALAVERPVPLRQFAALLAILVATLSRVQFASLYPALVLALVLAVVLLPDRSARAYRSLASLWPTVVPVLVAFVGLGISAVARSPSDTFGAYTALWGNIDPVDAAVSLVYDLSAVGMYLALIPVVLAPIALSASYVRARAGSERHAGFLATFASMNVALLFTTAAVDSSKYGLDRVHDRYLFYVIPLWLLVLAFWLQSGAPWSTRTAIIGLALAVGIAFAYPTHLLDAADGGKLFHGVGTTVWAAAEQAFDSTQAPRAVMVVLALLVAVGAWLLPRARRWVLAGVTLCFLVASSVLAWGVALNDVRDNWAPILESTSTSRMWVDERTGARPAATLFVSCRLTDRARTDWDRRSLFQTAFFNATGADASVGGRYTFTMPSSSVSIDRDGTVVLPSGRPLRAEFLIAQPGVSVSGTRVASGTSSGLTLWEVGSAVRLSNVRSAQGLRSAVCRTAAG